MRFGQRACKACLLEKAMSKFPALTQHIQCNELSMAVHKLFQANAANAMLICLWLCAKLPGSMISVKRIERDDLFVAMCRTLQHWRCKLRSC